MVSMIPRLNSEGVAESPKRLPALDVGAEVQLEHIAHVHRGDCRRNHQRSDQSESNVQGPPLSPAVDRS